MPRLILAALALLLLGRGAAADPLVLRAAWITTPASLIPILFAPPGIAERNGKSYRLEPVYYQSSPKQITALATGDLEVGTLNFTSFPFAVLNAKLDLRIIADETEDGYDDSATIQFKVRRDDSIRSPADLKGRALGVTGVGAATDIALRAELLRFGLHAPADYTEVEVRPPNAKSMLLSNKVALITSGLPFSLDPELIAKSRTLFTMKDAMGPSALSFWVARADFIKAHRAALVDLLADTIRAYHWYADPANHDAAVSILAKFTKQPPARLTQWAFTKHGIYRNRNAMPDLAMIQHDVDTMTKLGFIKQHLDIASHADLSLVKEAQKEVAAK